MISLTQASLKSFRLSSVLGEDTPQEGDISSLNQVKGWTVDSNQYAEFEKRTRIGYSDC